MPLPSVVRGAIAVTLVLAAVGCQREERDQPDGPRTCGWTASTPLTETGIGDLRIGASDDDVLRQCKVLRDSVETNIDGHPQRMMLVSVGAGTVHAELTRDRVSRLVVLDSTYRTQDGLGAGITLSRLIDASIEWAGNGEYGNVMVGVSLHCGMVFRLDGNTPGLPKPWKVSGVDPLRIAPPNTRVDAVLMGGTEGCENRPPGERLEVAKGHHANVRNTALFELPDSGGWIVNGQPIDSSRIAPFMANLFRSRDTLQRAVFVWQNPRRKYNDHAFIDWRARAELGRAYDAQLSGFPRNAKR